MRAFLIPWLTLSVLLVPVAQAHSEAHQHGHAQLDVLLEDAQLYLELSSPAANLLGFEHAPSNVAQQQRLLEVQTQLTQARLLNLSAKALCRLSSQQLQMPLFQASEQQTHSDIHLQQQWQCTHPSALDGLDFSPLLQQWPGIEHLHIQLIGPFGQQGAHLTRQHPRLELKHE